VAEIATVIHKISMKLHLQAESFTIFRSVQGCQKGNFGYTPVNFAAEEGSTLSPSLFEFLTYYRELRSAYGKNKKM
jgi:hypothetical protein